jgi:hypothetical protein
MSMDVHKKLKSRKEGRDRLCMYRITAPCARLSRRGVQMSHFPMAPQPCADGGGGGGG